MKRQNGTLQKIVINENSSKVSSKNTVGSGQPNTEKIAKGKPVPASVCPQDPKVNSKVPRVSKTNQSNALKRQKDGATSVSDHKAKKMKKDVVEDTKPTE